MSGTPKRCAGNCNCFSSAGSVTVAGRSPVRFLSKEGGIELVECQCAEERGVVGLLQKEEAAAAAAPDPEKKPPAQAQTSWKVAEELAYLAFGFFLSRASWVIIKTTDTALLGHVSTEVLSASAVGDLWMSSTGVVVMGGVLGTFVGNSLGAGNKKQAGIWLQVSLVVLSFLTLPVMLLWFVTGPVLRSMGAEQQLAKDAGFFATILALCLPGRTAYGQLTQFFSAQKIVRPTAYVSSAGCLLNLILGLVLVLGVFVPGWGGFGFPACPWTTVVTEYAMVSVLWYYTCHLKRLHEDCWAGWDTDEITWARIKEYLRMYIPAAASGASDWWRVTVIGVFAARLGPLQIAVFNTGYRITWMTLTFVGSLGGALGARLGIQIGAGDIEGGKQTVRVGGTMCCTALAVLSILVFSSVRELAMIFSEDPEVIKAFVEVRTPLSAMLFVMNLSVFLERILIAMGRTKVVFYAGVLGSWVGQVPGVILVMMFWRNDLLGLYWGVTFGYLLLCVVLLRIIYSLSWEEIVQEAKARGAASRK